MALYKNKKTLYALFFLEIQIRIGIRQPNAPAPQDVLVGPDRVSPSIKILASRSNSGLGRRNSSGLARAVVHRIGA